MKTIENKCCIKCVNLKHTGTFVFYTAVYKCILINGIVDPTSYCDHFQEMKIELFKKHVLPIGKPYEEGFRGFSEPFSGYIKTEERQVISL